MQSIHTYKRGGAIIGLVIAVVGVLTGGIGLLILDAVTCDFNVVFTSGCDNGGGGGGGSGDGGGGVTTPPPPPPPVACISPQNSCGMTNTGFIGSDGVTCNATAPSDSQCAAPTITVGTGFYASPNPVRAGQSTTITWSTSNSTSCTLTGGGLNQTGGSSGTVTTGTIDQPTNYTLTCSNGTVSQSSATITVRLIPKYKEI